MQANSTNFNIKSNTEKDVPEHLFLKDNEDFLSFVVEIMYVTRELRSYITNRWPGRIEISANVGGQIRSVSVLTLFDSMLIKYELPSHPEEPVPKPLTYYPNTTPVSDALLYAAIHQIDHWLRYGNASPQAIVLSDD